MSYLLGIPYTGKNIKNTVDTVPEDFRAGNYSVNLTYNGNDDYNPSNGSSNAEVVALDTVVSAGNVLMKK